MAYKPKPNRNIMQYIKRLILLTVMAQAPVALGQEYLQDRGAGIPLSLFGAYIGKGELLVLPFYEFTRDRNREYQPREFGFGSEEDFRGKFQSSSGQVFVAYGLSDRLALEFEAALMSVSFDKAPRDALTAPARIEESGFTDIEGQLRWRWSEENDRRPEIFSYLEITVPSQRHKLLIGDHNWDFRPGVGLVKGFTWGTVTVRSDLEYNLEPDVLDVGETAVEYLKRLSSAWRLYLGIEGGEGGAIDEWDFISGVQWRVTDFAFVKVDNALGISSKSPDWAPQFGALFLFPIR
jgi:hypothetical protein